MKIKLLIGVFLVICFTMSMAFAGENQLIIELPQFDIELEKGLNGEAVFEGATVGGEPGDPSLPYQSITVLLPPDADPKSVKVTLTDSVYEMVDGVWDVQPVPPLMVSGSSQEFWPQGSVIENGRNQNVYKKNQFFPESNIGRVTAGQKRQWKLAEALIYPFQYNPVEGKLRRLVKSKLLVSYSNQFSVKPNSADYDPMSEELKEELSKKVINFDAIAPEYESQKVNGSANLKQSYVIITTDEIQKASAKLADFIKFKESQGFNVEVVTEKNWGGGNGNEAADNIRNWLKNNYVKRNIKYVLLIGDPNPQYGDVPMKMCYALPVGNLYEECPTDLYYAELTGDWDLNKNGRYGEYDGDYLQGGIDLHFEVVVGRIPHYGNIGDLDYILSKTINYTKSGNLSWRKNVLLAMKPSDEYTPGYHLGEQIKNDVIIPKGWDYHRVYDEDYNINPPPETTPTIVENVKNTWTQKRFGAVFWWTHGWSQGASGILDTSHVHLLNDSYPVFTFQCSCHNSCLEDSYNLSYALLRNGAVGTVGGTRVTWYSQRQTHFENTSSNAGMTYEYAKRLITEEMPAGEALQSLKEDISPVGFGFWMNYLDIVLYGDPSVGLFNDTQKPIDLFISEFTWSRAKVTVNSPVIFRATVTNQGLSEIPAGTAILVRFTDENGVTLVETNRTYLRAPLAPGGTLSLVANKIWNPSRAGEYTISAEVVCDIADEWQDNNAISRKFSVSGDVLFSDDFENGAGNWATQDGNWSVVSDDGSNVYYQSKATEGRSWVPNLSWADCSVQARVNVVDFNGSNRVYVCARYKDGNNFYAASLTNSSSGGKLELRKKVNGSTTTLASKTYRLKTGAWYDVKIEVRGSQINMYVNDELQLTATDTSLSAGSVGLIAYKALAKFDDVVVTE